MLVEDVMRRDVVTASPKTTLPTALALVQRRGIRHLPVVEDGSLVGIVSDRDLKRAMASSATSLERHELAYLLDRLTLAEFMTRAVMTVAPSFPVEEAARLMVKEKVSALPVTEGGRLVGIVTETDVLDLFVRAMGAGEPSSRIDVVLKEPSASLAEVVRAIEDVETMISSVVTLPGRAGRREVVVRVKTINPGPAIGRLEARGYTVRNPWRG
ncbi:MAG: CBS domain-containing protein [Candidatus Rokubacteria bacterium]|nr:CBS domain-containing protein [Candidatus Rokubacteria bacterium]